MEDKIEELQGNIATMELAFVKKYNGNITDLADLKEQMEAILNDKQ